MNKKQLTARVQRYMGPGATQSTASAAVEAVLGSILALSAAERLHITRFGSFERRLTPARCARGVAAAGGAARSEPRVRLTFSPSKGFPVRPI